MSGSSRLEAGMCGENHHIFSRCGGNVNLYYCMLILITKLWQASENHAHFKSIYEL